MSTKLGQDLGGIRSIQDLKDRCWIDADTGCWRFRSGKRDSPTLYLPALKARTSLGSAICILVTGERVKKGMAWFCKCQTKRCANPAHREERASHTASRPGVPKTAAARQRIAAAQRASSKVTETIAREIRESDEATKHLAQRCGLHTSTVNRIRRGRAWAVQGASVFSWRPQ